MIAVCLMNSEYKVTSLYYKLIMPPVLSVIISTNYNVILVIFETSSFVSRIVWYTRVTLYFDCEAPINSKLLHLPRGTHRYLNDVPAQGVENLKQN